LAPHEVSIGIAAWLSRRYFQSFSFEENARILASTASKSGGVVLNISPCMAE
jgi:hypothetical protein